MFTKIAKPAECPACGCDVGVRVLRAWRQAGGKAEQAGWVTDCAQCGYRYTVLRDGAVLRFRGPAPTAQAGSAPPPPGGQATGRPGGLDPDMVTFDPPTSGF